MSRDKRSHKETNWTCFLCQETGEQDSHLNPDIPIKESAKGMRTVTRSSLRILQWNADGLKSKSDELASRLKSGDIDVAVIQETWLTKSDGTPNVGSEYIAIREDRKVNIQRGGLIIYVRKSVIYDRLGYISKRGTKILSIRVRLTKSKWITLTNYYIPPPDSTGQVIEFDTSLIPVSPSSIICGDFNAHHPSWDAIQPEDARGLTTLEWACSNDLSILNDPESPTRHNRATGNGSSPDLTVVGGNWSEKSVWAVDEEEIGGSDHLPIIITVHATVNHQPVTSANQRWRTNGINWTNFRNQVEDSCPHPHP